MHRSIVNQTNLLNSLYSSFAYLDYYTPLATVRGAEARKGQAVAFDIEAIGERRVLDDLP